MTLRQGTGMSNETDDRRLASEAAVNEAREAAQEALRRGLDAALRSRHDATESKPKKDRDR